jgi:hypothetical protein
MKKLIIAFLISLMPTVAFADSNCTTCITAREFGKAGIIDLKGSIGKLTTIAALFTANGKTIITNPRTNKVVHVTLSLAKSRFSAGGFGFSIAVPSTYKVHVVVRSTDILIADDYDLTAKSIIAILQAIPKPVIVPVTPPRAAISPIRELRREQGFDYANLSWMRRVTGPRYMTN